MREIKFRGKRICNGEWLFGDLMHDNIGGSYIYPIEAKNLYKENAVTPDTVGQYTGLKDKNDKEIYEGDIVEVTQLDGYNVAERGIVEYKESDCRYVIRIPIPICSDIFIFRELTNGLCKKNDGRCTIKWYNKYVVLGNIYDNPELIKEEEK